HSQRYPLSLHDALPILKESQQQARETLANAQSEARSMVTEAEERARRTTEEAERDLREELIRLESARQQLHQDIIVLERHVEEEDRKSTRLNSSHRTIS